jgi:hypothetical protein
VAGGAGTRRVSLSIEAEACRRVPFYRHSTSLVVVHEARRIRIHPPRPSTIGRGRPSPDLRTSKPEGDWRGTPNP